MNPLQHIPAKTRRTLYWIGYVTGVVGQGIAVAWAAVLAATPDAEMPVGILVFSALLGLATTQLNLLAGSNMSDPDAGS